MTVTSSLLALDGVDKVYGQGQRAVRALSGVSLALMPGMALALVGGSGSGKTTCARLLTGLEAPTRGRVLFKGRDWHATSGLAARRTFARSVQIVFQDPFAVLNPVHTIHHHLARPLLRYHGRRSAGALRERVAELLGDVGLEAEMMQRYPHQLSGGQRQRVNIARALAAEPEVLIADEPTSMLDVSLRLDVLGIFQRLKRERNVALLYITHDLATAHHIADRIAVMHKGELVEEGPAAAIVADPRHEYTRALLAAVPDPDRSRSAALDTAPDLSRRDP